MRDLILTPTMDFRFAEPPRVFSGSTIVLARAGCEVEVATMGDIGEADVIRGAWPEMAEQQIPFTRIPSRISSTDRLSRG